MAKIILRGSAPYWEPIARDSPLVYLNFNLPFACNYRCLGCCNWGRGAPFCPRSSLLSLAETERMIKEAADLGAKVLAVFGEGEPFLYPRIKQLIALASANGLMPYIFTNGSLLSGERLRFLQDEGASLIFNIGSFRPEIYEKLTQPLEPGAFSRVMANLGLAQRLFSGTEVSRLAINTVLNRFNCQEVKDIQAYCQREGLAFTANEPIYIGNASINADILYGSPKDRTEIRRVAKEMSKTNGPLGTTQIGDLLWCAYMNYGITVRYDGEVLVCPYAMETPSNLIGNIRQGGLSRYVRQQARESMPMELVQAFYEQFGHCRCLLRHPQYQAFLRIVQKVR